VPGLTPFQTVGPFFDILLRTRHPSTVPDGDAPALRVEGRLVDGAGAPVSDALVESWQTEAGGHYAWCHTDREGGFRLEAVMPGPVAGPDGRPQAPHVLVSVMARGILTRYVTRLYLDGHVANDSDPILALVPPARRATLMARPDGDGRCRFDIVLQGARETVFFDV
jgi:protocatechuate 3,4-dioxygenase alpha subunit